MKTLFLLLLLTVPAAAQTIDTVRPDCAVPGSRVLICGDRFGDDPVVSIAGFRAQVLRSHDSKILALVPHDAASGEARISVGSAGASIDIHASGAPVVRRLSAHTATPGQLLVLIGRNLRGAEAAFVDADGAEVTSVRLRGRNRVGFFRVPRDLAPARYTLEVRNDAGSSGRCSPKIAIVEAGPPTLDSIHPEGQHPGRSLIASGSDLGPVGLCVAHWSGGGQQLAAGGFANGYDRVFTYVPFQTVAGQTYKVHIEFADGSSTADSGLLSYTVGSTSGPRIRGLQFESGPAGGPVGILGDGFFPARVNAVRAIAIADALPVVEFTRDGVAHKARILFGTPGRGDEGDFLVVRVPQVADGDYDVTVTVGGVSSNAVVFTVKELPLTVTSMRPDHQSSRGFVYPVLFTGTGFGSGLDAQDIEITWERDGSARNGRLLFRNDREMFVLPPGGSSSERLGVGKYLVRVTRYPGTDKQVSVVAGTYTVE